MEIYAWLFGTAVLFTIVGWYMGKTSSVELIIQSTVDSLIDDGYIKTEGYGDKMEIVKWEDWCRKNDTD